jgi:hypothetical protein
MGQQTARGNSASCHAQHEEAAILRERFLHFSIAA